jgi:uncharacterized membrane protein (DUF2068 family)
MSMQRIRRPGVVTFIGAIILIQAFLSAVVAVVTLAFKDDVIDFLADQGGTQSESSLTGTAIGAAIAALFLFIVGSGILRGSRGWRLFVVLVQAVNMGFALYLMITHPHSAYMTSGLVTLLIGVFVIWALYGHKESEEYFESS